MGVTSELLANATDPHSIEHGGRVYDIKPIDQDVQSAFEKVLYKKDRDKAKTLRELDISTEEEYAADEARMKAAFRSGEYEMLSEAGLKRLASLDGVKILLSLIVPCSQIELFALLHAKQAELLGKLQLVIQESFPGVEFAMTGEVIGDTPPKGDEASPNA